MPDSARAPTRALCLRPTAARATRTYVGLAAWVWLVAACAPPPSAPAEAAHARPVDRVARQEGQGPAPTAQPQAAHDPADVHEPVSSAGAPGLTRITGSDAMCMLSNRYLGAHDHVPVSVDNHTYFGCCASCAARLGANAAARVAIDPTSGQQVDKARAVIARDERNRLLYFESEATYASARDRNASPKP